MTEEPLEPQTECIIQPSEGKNAFELRNELEACNCPQHKDYPPTDPTIEGRALAFDAIKPGDIKMLDLVEQNMTDQFPPAAAIALANEMAKLPPSAKMMDYLERDKPKTNPNGANQYHLDPRQLLCWKAYINPKSETFGNAKQSAINAGYEPDYADQITTSEWFMGKLRRMNMLSKAEKVLDDTLEMPVQVQEVQGYGEDKELVVVTEPALVKIKQDTAKFIAERLGKAEGYSSRTELTGADGKDLVEVDAAAKAKAYQVLNDFLHPRDPR